MQELSAQQLRRAAEIKEKIEELQNELNQILEGRGGKIKSNTSVFRRRGPQSAAARERIAAAQRLRWAKFHAKKKTSKAS